MSDINPVHYQSVTDYLLALSFTIAEDCFVKSGVSIPVSEIVGYTPVTFHAKAKAKGWFTEEPREEPTLYQWGDQFVFTSDFLVSHTVLRPDYRVVTIWEDGSEVWRAPVDEKQDIDAVLSEDWTAWFKNRPSIAAATDASCVWA